MSTHHMEPGLAAEAGRARGPVLSFTLHLAEMVAAMAAGMLLISPVLDRAAVAAAGADLAARPEAEAAVMATGMTLGMAIWMVHRGHRGAPVLEMAAAMYVPFLACLAPYWAGAVSGGPALAAGHVLMVPAMVLVMLTRREEYGAPVHAGHARGAAGRIVHAVSHRWPSLVALGLTFDSWFSPALPPAVLLVALGAENLVIGLIRRQFADRRLLAAHIAGAAFYLVLAATAYTAGGRAGIVLTAAGWLLHTGWDGVLYRMNKVVWRWYAEACAVLDLVLGVTILFLL